MECDAKTMWEVSFLVEKNSNGVASSKGWIAFFLVNFMAWGFLRACWWRLLGLYETVVGGGGGEGALTRSPRACRVSSLVDVPERRSVFFWFSTSLASRSSSTRLERALRGFLESISFSLRQWLKFILVEGSYLHCADHGCSTL